MSCVKTAEQLGESGPKSKSSAMRNCLKCSTMFRSDGPGNRICIGCSKINSKFGGVCRNIDQNLTEWLKEDVKRHKKSRAKLFDILHSEFA